MKSIIKWVRFLLPSIIIVAVCGCGGGGGSPAQQSSSSVIAASTTTLINGSSAICTVTISGASAPIIYGFDLTLNYPSGVTIASVNQTSLTASGQLQANGNDIYFATSNPFAYGDVLNITYSNVPPSAKSQDFSISNFVPYGGLGQPIS